MHITRYNTYQRIAAASVIALVGASALVACGSDNDFRRCFSIREMSNDPNLKPHVNLDNGDIAAYPIAAMKTYLGFDDTSIQLFTGWTNAKSDIAGALNDQRSDMATPIRQPHDRVGFEIHWNDPTNFSKAGTVQAYNAATIAQEHVFQGSVFDEDSFLELDCSTNGVIHTYTANDLGK